jgi:hypothetical protein
MNSVAAGVQEFEAQCRECAEPEIVRGAASDAEQQSRDAGLSGGRAEQFTRSQ